MKFHFTMLTVTGALLALLGCAATVPTPAVANPAARIAIDRWADSYPQAAADLGTWARNHHEAARKFFEWDGSHPEKSRTFVTWAITRRGEGIDLFVAGHPNWPAFDRIMERHRPAAQTFVAWCRRHPNAAEAIVANPQGLKWAGNHIYKIY